MFVWAKENVCKKKMFVCAKENVGLGKKKMLVWAKRKNSGQKEDAMYKGETASVITAAAKTHCKTCMR
jgi:hypothetical protein